MQSNNEKIQLCKTKVFTKHATSGEGLKIHPDKVQANLEMPDLEHAAAVHRLIVMKYTFLNLCLICLTLLSLCDR